MKITFQFWPPRLGIVLTGRAPFEARHRARSCTSKIRYGRLETARRAIMEQPERRLDSYCCRYCGGHHLYTI